jgi:dihydropteroate synthase
MVMEGAEIIDVGGESTRPGSAGVEEAEELRRVMPVVERLVGVLGVPISIDTQKPGVARVALAAGAQIVNDIGANRQDSEMWCEVASRAAGYVCMHMKGEPRTMQEAPEYSDVVAEVSSFFDDRLARLREAGVNGEQVVLDVGIGFGKKLDHNLQLLAGLERFKKWQRPLLLGVSRKSFLSALLGGDVEDRLPGSLACACWAVGQGVGILRVHDVAETVRAVRLTEALLTRV